ncbi:hypothetical protein HN51_012169 [Arachis hypogaea]
MGKERFYFLVLYTTPEAHTPQMWLELIQKAKEGRLDVIQTYVFWNGHEPSPEKYYFEDKYKLS